MTAPAAAGPSPRQRRIAVGCLAAVSLFYLFCYSGTLLASLAGIWSHTPLPESYVASHYVSALENETGSFVNTLVYCGIAAVIDVLAGLTMALAIERSPARWQRTLSWAATGLLSVPGVALAIAYLQFFQGMQLFGRPLDATWFLLPMAFSVRGLPFAIRACAFALQNMPAPYLEAALMSGASRLAITTGTPIVPIAVTSAKCWPRKAFIKYPGVVDVSIGEPIATAGRKHDELTEQVQAWIEAEMRRLDPEAYVGRES